MRSLIDRPNPCDCDASAARTFDYRNLVIEDQALVLLLDAEHIASLEADVGVYRELACAAVDALRAVTNERDRLRQSLSCVTADYRALREHILLNCGADDDGPA